ncbi:MAG: ABC transporter permease [Ignavibacteriaceae bacterium]|nr:ABC transporter permease [Ignavibacteriaceae bacterium]
MNRTELLKLGLAGLLANKTRAGLTMLGIIFGVASVIAMMSIGEGARVETLQQIEMLGTNNIIINRIDNPRRTPGATVAYSPGLVIKDAESIQDINPFVESVTPARFLMLRVQYGSFADEMQIIGTTEEYPNTFNTRLLAGSFFKDYDLESAANVCVIGSGIKEEIFRFEDPLKKKIKIANSWFTIIGVAAPKNISSAGMKSFGLRDFNKDIYIPFSSMASKLEEPAESGGRSITITRGRGRMNNNEQEAPKIDKNSVDQLTVKVKNSDQLTSAADLIRRQLERRHYGVRDFEMILPEQLLAQKQKTQRIFNIVMGAIAGISLLVGGIGIMNIMLANILERTKEIGIRRAIGATRDDVLYQFLFEALLISITGGIAGIVLGFVLTSLISTYAEWKTVISMLSVIIAFIVSAATGVIFGIYPAKKAADKDPIEALRYE